MQFSITARRQDTGGTMVIGMNVEGIPAIDAAREEAIVRFFDFTRAVGGNDWLIESAALVAPVRYR